MIYEITCKENAWIVPERLKPILITEGFRYVLVALNTPSKRINLFNFFFQNHTPPNLAIDKTNYEKLLAFDSTLNQNYKQIQEKSHFFKLLNLLSKYQRNYRYQSKRNSIVGMKFNHHRYYQIVSVLQKYLSEYSGQDEYILTINKSLHSLILATMYALKQQAPMFHSHLQKCFKHDYWVLYEPTCEPDFNLVINSVPDGQGRGE